MADQETLVDDVTETSNNTQAKTYTQEEFDAAMAKTKTSVEHKVSKRYAGYDELGSIEELQELKSQADKLRQKKLMEKGEFEKILQEKVAKFESEISDRDKVIREYKVNTPLINAAAKYKAVNPEQVTTLLMPSISLNETGEVVVMDADGKPRYGDDGHLVGVDTAVREFLDSNPHFVQATPSTTNTKSSQGTAVDNFDLSKLDMTNPEHRAIYAKHKKAQRLG